MSQSDAPRGDDAASSPWPLPTDDGDLDDVEISFPEEFEPASASVMTLPPPVPVYAPRAEVLPLPSEEFSGPIVRLLKLVLLLALRDRASSVEFVWQETEPSRQDSKTLAIFVAQNGERFEMIPPPRHLYPQLRGQLLVWAGLDPAVESATGSFRVCYNLRRQPIGQYPIYASLTVSADADGVRIEIDRPEIDLLSDARLDLPQNPYYGRAGSWQLFRALFNVWRSGEFKPLPIHEVDAERDLRGLLATAATNGTRSLEISFVAGEDAEAADGAGKWSGDSSPHVWSVVRADGKEVSRQSASRGPEYIGLLKRWVGLESAVISPQSGSFDLRASLNGNGSWRKITAHVETRLVECNGKTREGATVMLEPAA